MKTAYTLVRPTCRFRRQGARLYRINTTPANTPRYREYTAVRWRAVQSAEILFPDREIVTVDDLREMDFGVFENASAADLVKLDSYKKWLKGGLDNPPPNGESLRNMMLRCYSALNLMILNMMNEGITHAGVVTHSGILMNMMSCFGLPKMKPMEFVCDPGEGYEILVSAMMWQNGNTFEILGKIPDRGEIDD